MKSETTAPLLSTLYAHPMPSELVCEGDIPYLEPAAVLLLLTKFKGPEIFVVVDCYSSHSGLFTALIFTALSIKFLFLWLL